MQLVRMWSWCLANDLVCLTVGSAACVKLAPCNYGSICSPCLATKAAAAGADIYWLPWTIKL
jgi:hypothetical protein